MPLPRELEDAFRIDELAIRSKKTRAFVMFLSMFFFIVVMIAVFFGFVYTRQKTTDPPRGNLIRSGIPDYLHLFSNQYEIGYSTPLELIFSADKNMSPGDKINQLRFVDAIFSDGPITNGFTISFYGTGQKIVIGAASEATVTDFTGSISRIEWVRKPNTIYLIDANDEILEHVALPGIVIPPSTLEKVKSLKTEGTLTIDVTLVYDTGSVQVINNPSNTPITFPLSGKLVQIIWGNKKVLPKRMGPSKIPAPPVPALTRR